MVWLCKLNKLDIFKQSRLQFCPLTNFLPSLCLVVLLLSVYGMAVFIGAVQTQPTPLAGEGLKLQLCYTAIQTADGSHCRTLIFEAFISISNFLRKN